LRWRQPNPRGSPLAKEPSPTLSDGDNSLPRRLSHDTPGGPVPGEATTFAKWNYSSRPAWSVHWLVRSPRPLQLLDRRCDLAPDGCALFVTFASENHRPRSGVKL